MAAKRLKIVPRSRFWWYFSKWAVLLFSKVWFRVSREGAEHVPSDGPVLLVANHCSYLDPPMVGICTDREVNFLAQAGLASFPPLRWWLRQVGVTLIDRNAPSKEAMRLLGNCLKGGEVVGIFPEGTRSKTGEVMPFKSGVEFLVRRAKATVVPIGIDGTFAAFPRKAWFAKPRKVVVRFGEPWTHQQVLADGGVEALRRRVAELARRPMAPLRCLDVTGNAAADVSSSQALAADPSSSISPHGSSHSYSGSSPASSSNSSNSSNIADVAAPSSHPQNPLDRTA